MTEQERILQHTLQCIRPADEEVVRAARKYADSLVKPPGSLGQLEEIAAKLAGITGRIKNEIKKTRITVLAADNGVCVEGVSSAPQRVTAEQAVNMTREITGMAALAAEFGCEVQVTDVGIATPYICDAIRNAKIRRGTGNLLRGRAMSREEVLSALCTGISLAEEAKRDGISALGVGEMGIGNTTSSSAVLAVLTGKPVRELTGRGGGLTDAAYERKRCVIEEALRFHHPDPADVIGVLGCVGGLDLAAMCGVFLGCAALRLPAVADGFISVTAALCAAYLAPAVRDVLFLSHVSAEPGYAAAREALGLPAYLLLDLRLGEGSGCPLAFQVLKAACAMMRNMATFEEARIDDRYLAEIRAQEERQ